MWQQKTLYLSAKKRGFHLITDEIEQQLPQLRDYSVGLLHLFIQHTSASLTLNENADPTVRTDMESHFNRYVPEDAPITVIPMKAATICLRILRAHYLVQACRFRLAMAG
ncbi:hypothetical protein JCM19240_3281 [Vibrio maritimus]|uniref:Uncharacterized protein n=1 Tax=Vibrio maritimus TaxID=990268 RepID=A0A090TEG8_9VIBR|nr:hypothetical protein JCM19240_3281 [Vibrio maritimus]